MGVGAVSRTRVSLRAVGHDDWSAIAAWYNEAAAAAYEERAIEELRGDDLFAVIRPEEGAPIGLLEYRREGEWVSIPFIALAKAYRGWGYGSEAIRLLEDWAVREGRAKRFGADVDVRNGLGLYFWLRLGYRPATPGEFNWQRDGTQDKMPMIRLGDKARNVARHLQMPPSPEIESTGPHSGDLPRAIES